MAGAAEPPRRGGRLFRKYLLVFVALVGGALVTSGAVETYFSYQEQRASLSQLQREKAVAAAATIEHFVLETQRQLGWTFRPPWLQETTTLADREEDLARLLRQAPAITETSYLDSTGREQVRVSRLAMNALGSGRDLSQDPRFRTAKSGRPYFGPVYFRNDSEPYLTLAVAEPGALGGVVTVEVNLKFILETISGIRVGRAGFAYAVDSSGHLIAHPDISLVLQKTDLSARPQVSSAREAGVGGAAGFLAPGLRAGQALTSAAGIEPLGWLVFIEQPLEEAFAPLYGSLGRTALLLILGLALAGAAGFLLARRMVTPIRALERGAARIGAGVLDQRIDVKTGDELETLADSFNTMAVQLQDYYASLEQRVDLARAREIQDRLLPKTLTAWPTGLEIGWRFRSARDMSGDFYDVLPLVPPDADPRSLPERPPLLVSVGDVQGKGIAAALIMALARATLRAVAESSLGRTTGAPAPALALAAPYGGATPAGANGHSPSLLLPTASTDTIPSPATLLRLAGGLLHRGAGRRDFVACALAVVEPPTADAPTVRLRVANAAQVPVLHYRAGRVQELTPPGERLPLAILSQPDYQEISLPLLPGDVVVLSSDGLVEAPSTATGELFGFPRLSACIARRSAAARSAEEIAAGVWDDLSAWCGTDPYHDDVTLLVLRVPTV